MAASLASFALNVYGLSSLSPFSTKTGKDPTWQPFLLRFAQLQYGVSDRFLSTVTHEFVWDRFVPGDTDGFIPLTRVLQRLFCCTAPLNIVFLSPFLFSRTLPSRSAERWNCPALTWPQLTRFSRALKQKGIYWASMPVYNMEKVVGVSKRLGEGVELLDPPPCLLRGKDGITALAHPRWSPPLESAPYDLNPRGSTWATPF